MPQENEKKKWSMKTEANCTGKVGARVMAKIVFNNWLRYIVTNTFRIDPLSITQMQHYEKV